MTTPLFAATCILLLGPTPRQDAQGVPAAPVIELEDLAGKITRLSLDELPVDDLKARGVAFLRCEGFAAVSQAGVMDENNASVYLHCGAWLRGRLLGGSGDSIVLALGGASPVSLSIEEVASIRFPGRQPTGGSVLPEAPDEGDRLYLRRGAGLDRIDGLVDGFEPDGIRFQGRFGLKTHSWKEVVAVFVEQLDAPTANPASSPVVVDLRGGGRLGGDLGTVGAGGLEITTAAGTGLRIPLPLVREVMSADGSFQFLSDLSPSDRGPSDLFGGSEGLGMRYPVQVDRNYAGRILRTGGRAFARGLGVHAPSRLTWELDGSWKSLRLEAGLDDSALGGAYQGSVIFRVHVDGEERWASPVVRGGQSPLRVPTVDLTGARSLVLEVDPATEAFFCDRANWLRPVLVRAQ
ncbi:MAG TPA: hypothetical protein EYQ74_06355 [Planctomycetes bacterium]|nr:hypothetical protein [Planctomycetota bacterium]HIK60991.1 hypothetical protein [Planctomycetota bacterium]